MVGSIKTGALVGELIEGDDGSPVEVVGAWAKTKHEYLCRYVDISRGVRSKWLDQGKAGATLIDPFCGPGRCRIRGTSEFIDGGVVAAWKKSADSKTPFSAVYIGDIETERVEACGNCQEFCARGRFRHWLTNLSPKTTANWVLASNHSR
ncbi:three-Cys-motif partner protein TcmP, partial [Mesorhizobium sp. M0220]|uniref:three-Cys-motif partner protein TcmP n=3 Tax=Mesorhizobium TaxID=68287 RepID=UPI0033371EEB